MKRKTGLVLIAGSLVMGWLVQPVGAGCCSECAETPTLDSASVSALTDAEIEDLLLMREEEKLARDVYLTLSDEYDLRIFANIPKSEQRHMDAMLSLLNRYKIADPVLAERGAFVNGELQELSDALIAKGKISKLEALKVGALIEEVDIEDLISAMERTTHPDVKSAYANLLWGSKNHLRAFAFNMKGLTGETYVAQKMSQEEVDQILNRK